MTSLYVVGGRQKAGVSERVKEFHHYGAAVVVSAEIESGKLSLSHEYVTPPEACAEGDNPSILFKSATIENGVMYVPTQTEVLIYELPAFRRTGYISLSCFNDVHHVRPGPNGTLFVVSTGLDMVVEIARDGKILREWSAIGEDIWKRFDKSVDYRKVVSTKPHHSHPNQVFFLDDEIWTTRCDQRDIWCLSHDRPAIPISDKYIHDGVRRGNRLYFTAVSGEVVIVDAKKRAVVERFDLNAIAGGPPVGWCRGIEILDDDRVVVGFSRLRPTKWEQNIKWVKHQLGGDGHGLRPTRLAMFDLRKKELCWEIDLEPIGMNVVFSVHLVK